MRHARALLLACLVALSAAPQASAEPALWKVKGLHATVVLFGSVHLLPVGLDWEPPALTDAVAHADEIWFEIPINPATVAEVQRLTASKGFLRKGDSLLNHLTPAQTEDLDKACAALGVTPTYVTALRPWLAEMTLSIAQGMRAGALASEGVEQQISSQAPPIARREAFETVSQQIGFLADAPLSSQLGSLDETSRDITDDPDLFPRVLKEWIAGDVGGLAKDALDPLAKASPEMYRRLVTDRNRRWTETLARRLEGQGTIVVVVGAAHLIGPGGVPALLKARGFDVEGPDAH